MKTALVLSAGGMFAAYQAGAWSVLADCFEPDLIVGASAGALNGWAIAGGCTPGHLIEQWRTMDCAATYRWRIPRRIHAGILQNGPLQTRIDELYAAYRPRIEYALVTTEIATRNPRIFRSSEITADLLKASTAIPVLFDQVRIDGRTYSDGGVLAALPVWAAVELGADRIVAINALAMPPGVIPKLFVRVVKAFSRFRPVLRTGLDVLTIAPTAALGTGLDALYWTPENNERWIQQGRRDAIAQKHSIQNCFKRE